MQMEPATYHSYTDYSPRSIITQRSPARSSTAVECTSLSPRQCTNAWRQALRRRVSLHRASAAHLQRQ